MTSNFLIIRMKKIKSVVSVGRTIAHTLRSTKTPNADPEKTSQNLILHGTGNYSDSISCFKNIIESGVKPRKDAVLMIDFVITASPDFFRGMSREKINDFFTDSLSYISKIHGSENVLLAAVHFDETTPHMHVHVIPRTKDGRLSCKEFYGGKMALRDLQDNFFSHISSIGYDLKRGVKGSKATHVVIKNYYTSANAHDQENLESSKLIATEIKPNLDREQQAEILSRLTNRYSSKFGTPYCHHDHLMGETSADIPAPVPKRSWVNLEDEGLSM